MKSHARKYLPILQSIFIDAAGKCYTDSVHFGRDLKTLRSRVEHEGLSFLTITLPNFGKDFERSLDQGSVTSTSLFQGWKRKGCLPAFLWGFTRLVFDAAGKIKEDPDHAAIEGIRQIAYAFKKLKLQCSPKRETEAIKAYLDCEADFDGFTVDPVEYNDFIRFTHLVWGNVFGFYFNSQDTIPKHGPGATFERIAGNRKYAQNTWHERLQPFFPADSFIFSGNADDIEQRVGQVKFLQEDEEPPVRVVLVPKTLKTPRVIAIEPVCMQYTQQALASHIIEKLENSAFSAGRVNFTCQRINRNLAMASSQSGQYATLDLSEASDRVPASVVYDIFSFSPDLRDAIFACRSRRALLPDGTIVPLKKFASMGSALCFPIEAIYFYSIIVYSLIREAGLPVTLENAYRVSQSVRVYGDDIVVPVNSVAAAIRALQLYNCKVNANKSFWNGKFRESCGMDAYDGTEVTPVYVRQPYPNGRRDLSQYLLSRIATSNLFYLKGYWRTASFMKKEVEKVTGKLPLILDTSPGQGWVNYQHGYTVQRWNVKLHRFEVRTLIAVPTYRKDHIDGYPALQKFFLTSMHRRPDDQTDEEHLTRSVRSGTVNTKRRWTTPY